MQPLAARSFVFYKKFYYFLILKLFAYFVKVLFISSLKNRINLTQQIPDLIVITLFRESPYLIYSAILPRFTYSQPTSSVFSLMNLVQIYVPFNQCSRNTLY